jgi:hypothetical protein
MISCSNCPTQNSIIIYENSYYFDAFHNAPLLMPTSDITTIKINNDNEESC